MTDLAKLDEIARAEYQREVDKHLADPQRLSAAYDAQFVAADFKNQLNIICTTAKQLLNTDGAELNIITDKQIAMGTAMEPAKTIPADESLCQYVVNEKIPFGVEASLDHALVCMSPAVTEKGLRSYLGIPVIFKDQYVGALCVWNLHNTEWKGTDVTVLVYLAGLVMSLLEAV